MRTVRHALAQGHNSILCNPTGPLSPSMSQHQLAGGLLNSQGHLKARQGHHGTLEFQTLALYPWCLLQRRKAKGVPS